MNIILYFIVALINVFLHVFKNILVIKSTKLKASIANCICYTFAAVVIKCIADTELWIAITVQAITNFAGNWVAMWLYEIIEKKKGNIMDEEKQEWLEKQTKVDLLAIIKYGLRNTNAPESVNVEDIYYLIQSNPL